MENKNNKEELILKNPIGVIGSPSSTTELTLDVMGTAIDKKLVGELTIFEYSQDNKKHYALGQISEIQLKNMWLEGSTIKSLTRYKGRVDPLTELQDTHTAVMNISAVFSKRDDKKFEASMLGTVPATGTRIYSVDDDILKSLLKDYQDEIFYLGHVYLSKPLLPMWFKHFDRGKGGAGEAYHIGIFGKSGSGKSLIAKMMMLSYARHKDMAIFVIDPQGEFAKDTRKEREKWLNLRPILKDLEKEVKVYSIQNLVLDDWELFKEILASSKFFDAIIGSPEKRLLASDVIIELLKRWNRKGKIKKQVKTSTLNSFNTTTSNQQDSSDKDIKPYLNNLYRKEVFDIVWNDILGNDKRFWDKIYPSPSYRKQFKENYEDANEDEYYREWKRVTNLFTQENREKAFLIKNEIENIFTATKKPVIIIDLSEKSIPKNIIWNDTIKTLLIKRLLKALTEIAEDHYKEDKSLNTLVIIDEAHEHAPREKPEDETKKELRNTLIHAIRTTRKYGLGWMFISQTLSSLHKEIVSQLRISLFGFGLGIGTEYDELRKIASGTDALKLYQTFRDPHSSFDIESRQYPFMTVGPVSPLSFSGTPLFFTTFNPSTDLLTKFLEVNNLKKGNNEE